VLAAIGTAAAFAPSWDRYVLSAATTGRSQTITAGNAFDNPGMVIAGDVAVMAAIVAMAALAVLWRPARQGALLLAGAIVPLAAQAVSALIQVSQPVSPSMFGISASEASAAGLRISLGVTPIFWVYIVFVISLIVSCAWLFTEPGHTPLSGIPVPSWHHPAGDAPPREADPTAPAGTSAPQTDADGDTSGATDSGARPSAPAAATRDDAMQGDAMQGDGAQAADRAQADRVQADRT
jgi:hypothetical protein